MAISDERAAVIIMEETIPRRKKTPDRTDEERAYRKAIRKDIREQKKKGWEIVIPTTQPEPFEEKSAE